MCIIKNTKSINLSPEEQSKMLQWPIFKKSTLETIFIELSKGEDNYYSHANDFENEWKKYIGVKYVLSANSGTAAIHSSMFGLNLKKDSEILVPTYTYWASIIPMRYYSLVPVFCDVDSETGIIDLEDAKKRITNKTKAILVVHLWGMPANMKEIINFARENNLKIIEDASHAHGASWNGKKLGTIGDVGIFSFQSSKLMTTIEGGVLCTNNKDIYERALSLGHYKSINSLPNNHRLSFLKESCLGYKHRIHPVSAILGKLELKYLDDNNNSIIKVIEAFHKNLSMLKGIKIPQVNKLAKRVYYSNVIHIDYNKLGITKHDLINILSDAGCIFGRVQYPLQHTLKIYHKKKYWDRLPIFEGDYKGAEAIKQKELFLPRFSENTLELMNLYSSIFRNLKIFN